MLHYLFKVCYDPPAISYSKTMTSARSHQCNSHGNNLLQHILFIATCLNKLCIDRDFDICYLVAHMFLTVLLESY